jgi:diadenosine tetraphosphate (Ap4A) HIT family hydrolase
MTDLESAQSNGIAPWNDQVAELSDFHVTVFRDKYAVTPGHLLFVPNYNTVSVIMDAMESAVRHGNRMVELQQCDAYNVGINMGTAAGQTVMYPHVHLILRRTGDCADPVGGVRNVIPGKGNYRKYDTTTAT